MRGRAAHRTIYEIIARMEDFTQQSWNARIRDDASALIRLAVREDLDRHYDWTTIALVPSEAQAAALIVTRQAGIIAGLQVAKLVVEELNLQVTLSVF